MDTQWSQHLSKVVSLVFWLSMPFTSSLALWQSVLGLFMCLLLICPSGRSPPRVRDQAPSRAAPAPTCLTLGMVHVNPCGRKMLVTNHPASRQWSETSPCLWVWRRRLSQFQGSLLCLRWILLVAPGTQWLSLLCFVCSHILITLRGTFPAICFPQNFLANFPTLSFQMDFTGTKSQDMPWELWLALCALIDELGQIDIFVLLTLSSQEHYSYLTLFRA